MFTAYDWLCKPEFYDASHVKHFRLDMVSVVVLMKVRVSTGLAFPRALNNATRFAGLLGLLLVCLLCIIGFAKHESVMGVM
mgnify:CR=1 FL=1